MARMTREFSLVLVGSGILTAGYFAYPEEDLEAKQKEQAAQQLAGNNPNNRVGHRTFHPHILWIPTGGWSSRGGVNRSPAMGGNIARGGFGSLGRGSVGS